MNVCISSICIIIIINLTQPTFHYDQLLYHNHHQHNLYYNLFINQYTCIGTLYQTNLFLDFEDWRMGSRGFSLTG